jgi:RNA polymerase sigma-70 factor (ECF subfamily)
VSQAVAMSWESCVWPVGAPSRRRARVAVWRGEGLALTRAAGAWQRARSVDPSSTTSDAVRLEQALRDHQPLLLAVATRLTANPDDARDLVQDTFERALARADRFTAGTNLRAWLVTILKNRFIDQCRRRKRSPITAVLPDEPAAPAPVDDDEPPRWAAVTGEQVALALARLPEEFRRAYEMKEIERKSYAEIAAALGIPPATVGTRILRARRRLKQILEEMME